jgi:hypothetical protein
VADVDHAAQECPSREHNRPTEQRRTIGKTNPARPAAIHKQICNLSFNHSQPWSCSDLPLHGVTVQPSVGLCPWALNCRALATVKQAELYGGEIRHPAHHPVKGIDFPNEMTLPKATDGRVARHYTNA